MRKMKFVILMLIAALAFVSVASALPDTLTIKNADITGPNSPDSYFQIITQNGDTELPAGSHDAMCMGWKIFGKWYGTEWTTWDTRIANSYPDYMGTIEWNRVNWIANNVFDGSKYGFTASPDDWKITQAALWKLDGGKSSPGPYTDNAYIKTYDNAKFQAYWTAVQSAAAGSFVPGEGQYYVALLTKDANDWVAQPIAIRVYIPEHNIPSPEFPTLALPVAMLIGLAGAVEYVRTKKE